MAIPVGRQSGIQIIFTVTQRGGVIDKRKTVISREFYQRIIGFRYFGVGQDMGLRGKRGYGHCDNDFVRVFTFYIPDKHTVKLYESIGIRPGEVIQS